MKILRVMTAFAFGACLGQAGHPITSGWYWVLVGLFFAYSILVKADA